MSDLEQKKILIIFPILSWPVAYRTWAWVGLGRRVVAGASEWQPDS